MPIPYKIESIEGLPEPLAKEYKQIDEGGKQVFVLDLEGVHISEEPVDALKRAKDYEKKARQDAEKKAKDLEAARISLQEQIDEMRRGNIPKGDVDALEASWKKKLEEKSNEFSNQLSARDRTLQNLLVDSVASRIAGEISISPDLIIPHIKERLTTELVDGQFVTRVLDREKKPSALSIEELQKDISQDKKFAPIIKGSKASGGSASGGSIKPAGSGASPAFDLSKPFDYNKATPQQIAAYQKAKRAAEAERKGQTGG